MIEKIEAIVREAGEIILNAERTKEMISGKEGHANFVTTYDKAVQDFLYARLMTIVPGAAFVGEEGDMDRGIGMGYTFIVDPIDGTTNFIKDLHCSCISVGLLLDKKPYIGVVYNPYLNEMFTAKRGEGAFLNGKPIHVSKEPLNNGLVIFGTSPYYEDLHEQSFKLAFEFSKVCLDVRRSGSAALDLCNVAAGRAELFFELKLSPWDYAAGALIVTEAGGRVAQMEDRPLVYDQACSVIATNF